MQRVVVIGCGGAGKTTLSVELGRRLRLPVIHLDRHYWKPGWVETPAEEWNRVVQELMSGERWIMDGNYGGTLAARLAVADTAIFLDFPTWVCLQRVLGRWARHRGRTREDMAPGCPEMIDFEFLRWIATFRRKTRPSVAAALAERGEALRVVVLRNPREARVFLAGIGSGPPR